MLNVNRGTPSLAGVELVRICCPHGTCRRHLTYGNGRQSRQQAQKAESGCSATACIELNGCCPNGLACAVAGVQRHAGRADVRPEPMPDSCQPKPVQPLLRGCLQTGRLQGEKLHEQPSVCSL